MLYALCSTLYALRSVLHHQPFHHILNILHHQLLQPGQRLIGPSLRMEGEHDLIGQEAGVGDGYDILCVAKR